MHFGKMGIGPWYRIGLSMSNAVILAAIIETVSTLVIIYLLASLRICKKIKIYETAWILQIISCNAASHSLAYSLAKYQYGLHGHAPGHLPTEVASEWIHQKKCYTI